MTKDVKQISGNVADVVFPRDEFQLTQEVRRSGFKAARRVGGSKDKLLVLVKTLDVLKGHAIARYKKQAAVADRIRNDAATKSERIDAENRAASERRIKTAEAEVARMKEAHDPTPVVQGPPAPKS